MIRPFVSLNIWLLGFTSMVIGHQHGFTSMDSPAWSRFLERWASLKKTSLFSHLQTHRCRRRQFWIKTSKCSSSGNASPYAHWLRNGLQLEKCLQRVIAPYLNMQLSLRHTNELGLLQALTWLALWNWNGCEPSWAVFKLQGHAKWVFIFHSFDIRSVSTTNLNYFFLIVWVIRRPNAMCETMFSTRTQ